MPILLRGLWLFAVLGALVALSVCLVEIVRSENAERQAQCATVALAFVLTPYCLARAVEEVARRR